MTPRRAALAASSPALLLLLGSAVWCLWDRRAEIRRWVTDWP